MTPGMILFDPKFKFEDGEEGRKIFVVLTDGCYGDHVVAKTTSRGDRFGLQVGCQAADRYPNFFLPEHASCLREHTWIQLHVFYEFDSSKLSDRIVSGSILQIGALDLDLAKQLLICATHTDDVTGYQEREIQAALSSL